MKDLYPNQKEFDNKSDYESAIKTAKSIKALNQLRMAGVKFRDQELLKLWQDRFWAFKKCPNCAKVTYGL